MKNRRIATAARAFAAVAALILSLLFASGC